MTAKRKKKHDVYHTAIQTKSQKQISKEASQLQKRQQLTKEYRSQRRTNAFVDRRNRQSALLAAHNTKSAKFVLEDPTALGNSDTLGVPSVEAVQHIASDAPVSKKKENYLARFKQAKAERWIQVQKDKETLQQLDDDLKASGTTNALKKMTEGSKERERELDAEDIDFNQYLTMFSIASASAMTTEETSNKVVSKIIHAKKDDDVQDMLVMEEEQGEAEMEESIKSCSVSESCTAEEQWPSAQELQSNAAYKKPSSSSDDSKHQPPPTKSELSRQSDSESLPSVQYSADVQSEHGLSTEQRNEESPISMHSGGLDSSTGLGDKQPASRPNEQTYPDRQTSCLLIPAVEASADLSKYIEESEKDIRQCTANQRQEKQQTLFRELIQIFQEKAENDRDLDLLNVLTQKVSQLAQQLPEYTWTVTKAKVTELDLSFSRRLADSKEEANPTIQEFLLLKLLLCMYPLSETFHPISHAISLLLCRYLSEGRYKDRQAIVTSFHIASVLDNSLGKKFCAETVSFYKRLLTAVLEQKRHLEAKKHKTQMKVFTVEELLHGTRQKGFYRRVVFVCVMSCRRLSQKYQKAVCFPEIFTPIVESLKELMTSVQLSEELGDLCRKECLALKTSIIDRASSREPMRRSRDQSLGIRQQIPVFEENLQIEDFKKWKQEQMMDRRLLKKKHNKERRGAIKELRKDGLLLAQLREEEKREVDRQRLQNEKAFYNELQRFDDDLRQGGQAGMNPHLKKTKRLWKY